MAQLHWRIRLIAPGRWFLSMMPMVQLIMFAHWPFQGFPKPTLVYQSVGFNLLAFTVPLKTAMSRAGCCRPMDASRASRPQVALTFVGVN